MFLGNYTLRLSSFGGVALRDSPDVTYKNTLIGLTTWAPTRILEMLWVYLKKIIKLYEMKSMLRLSGGGGGVHREEKFGKCVCQRVTLNPFS